MNCLAPLHVNVQSLQLFISWSFFNFYAAQIMTTIALLPIYDTQTVRFIAFIPACHLEGFRFFTYSLVHRPKTPKGNENATITNIIRCLKKPLF